MSTLRELVQGELSGVDEERLQELIRRKVTAVVRLYVRAVRVAEAHGGPDAVESIRQDRLAAIEAGASGPRPGPATEALCTFCDELEAGCRGTHEWEVVERADGRRAYRFTRCLWAEVFRELDAADIGLWICHNDGPAAAAYDPRIRFSREHTLMEGHPCCDHVYYVEDEAPD